MESARKKEATNVLEVHDYGDPGLNRLALAIAALEQMEPNERDAALVFVGGKYKPSAG